MGIGFALARGTWGSTFEEEERAMLKYAARAALVFALMVPTACGGSSSSSSSDPTAQFKSSLSPVVGQLKQTSHAIGTAIEKAPSQTDAQIAVAFHALATQWQDHVSRLQTLKAPASLAVTFNTLTGAATRAEADLNAIVAAAQTHSAAAAKQASATLVTDILAAKAASTTITNKLGIQ